MIPGQFGKSNGGQQPANTSSAGYFGPHIKNKPNPSQENVKPVLADLDPINIEDIDEEKSEIQDINEEKSGIEDMEIQGLNDKLICPYCKFEAKNKLGLTSHVRLGHPDEYKIKKEVGDK